MKSVGNYAEMLSAALDGARLVQRHADARASRAADAFRGEGSRPRREALRAAEIARAAAAAEVAEIEGEAAFPELLEDEARFPELLH
ncbi:MAG: hypothetical protein ACU0BS_05965 [Hasllibacter sp.]